MANNKILMVENVPVTNIKQLDADFISLTDMVRQSESGSAVIDNWLRNKNTLEFLSVWEEIYNPAFNSLEFEEITVQGMCQEMVASDLSQAQKHARRKQHGYSVNVSVE